jgi:hypothetical protein
LLLELTVGRCPSALIWVDEETASMFLLEMTKRVYALSAFIWNTRVPRRAGFVFTRLPLFIMLLLS